MVGNHVACQRIPGELLAVQIFQGTVAAKIFRDYVVIE
jgi:hypothetical protein